MKKYLSELSRDELKSLFDNNEKLRMKIWEIAIENVDFWIGEYLHGMTRNAASYDISYCGQWMDVKNERDFFEWVENNIYTFDLFCDIENREKLIETGLTLYDRLNDYYLLLSDKNEERMQDRLDEICELFADAFIDCCRRGYDYFDDDENLFSFWLDEIGAQCGYWEECYTMGDGKVYRDYTKEIGA